MAKNSYSISNCEDPFTIFLKLDADPFEVGSKLLKARTEKNTEVILDIGGEGRFENAINLNPQFLTSTTGVEGRLIPNWLPGTGNQIPLADLSVDIIHLQNAPINIDTMKEMLRVLKPRSKIHLTHPSQYAQGYLNELENIFGKRNIRRVDKGIMSDFFIEVFP